MNFDKCEYNQGEFCVSIKCLIQTLNDYCILITRENKLFLGLTSLLTNENKLFWGLPQTFVIFYNNNNNIQKGKNYCFPNQGKKSSVSQPNLF